jgi:hypothetical protein
MNLHYRPTARRGAAPHPPSQQQQNSLESSLHACMYVQTGTFRDVSRTNELLPPVPHDALRHAIVRVCIGLDCADHHAYVRHRSVHSVEQWPALRISLPQDRTTVT